MLISGKGSDESRLDLHGVFAFGWVDAVSCRICMRIFRCHFSVGTYRHLLRVKRIDVFEAILDIAFDLLSFNRAQFW